MNIPKNIKLPELKKRADAAFANNDLWESLLDDAYTYFLPNRNLYNREDKGQSKMERIFDSTAILAIQRGASKLQENIAPIWQRWAVFEITEQVKRDAEGSEGFDENKIREQLEKQSEIAFDYINRSNFVTQFYEFALDLLIGTGTLSVQEENDDRMFSFHSLPQKYVAFEEGPDGKIETHWRKHNVEARNIERTWKGFKPSEKVKRIIKEKPDEKIKCVEGVVYDFEKKTYYGVVWVHDEQTCSWYYDYKGFTPFVTGRYSKVAGEIRGRGPAIQVLPDVKSLNKVKEFVLQKAAIDLAGMYTATDDGVTNPYSMKIAAGLVIPVGSNNSANPSIQRLDTGNNLDLALFEVSELQKHIKTALFNDLRDPEGKVRTATEIALDARELAKNIGSAYGRLMTEALVPIMKSVMYILNRRGILDPIVIDGKAVDIKFTSPLARAQDMEDILAVQQVLELTLATVGEEMMQAAIKVEDVPSWAAEKIGMPAELIRGKDEKAQVMQAGAQKEAAEAGMMEQPNDVG